jgi:hypothetical protein
MRPILKLHQLDLGAGKIDCGRDDVEPGNAGLYHRLIQRALAGEQLVAGKLTLRMHHAQPGRCITLRIEVDQKHAPTARG